MTYPMWLNPRSLAYISVMTVSSVWNLIKDSSYLYWHSLSASDWSTLVTAGLSLAAGWHLCAHCVTPGGAILNKIMTGLDWSQETFYLQFHSPHCLHARGQEDIRGHLGHWDRVQRKHQDDVWCCVDVSHVCWLLISASLSLSHLVPTNHKCHLSLSPHDSGEKCNAKTEKVAQKKG